MERKKDWFEKISLNEPLFKPVFPKPFSELDKMAREVYDSCDSKTPYGLKDEGDQYVMSVNLGGCAPKDDEITVNLEYDVLEVSYEHVDEGLVCGKGDHYYASHKQSTKAVVPCDADQNTIEAHFDEKEECRKQNGSKKYSY